MVPLTAPKASGAVLNNGALPTAAATGARADRGTADRKPPPRPCRWCPGQEMHWERFCANNPFNQAKANLTEAQARVYPNNSENMEDPEFNSNLADIQAAQVLPEN